MSQNVISRGENGVCVLEHHTAAGNVEGCFFSLSLSFSLSVSHVVPLLAPRQPRSICIRPLRVLWRLFAVVFSPAP